MKAKTKVALQKSIQHWHENLSHFRVGDYDAVGIFSDSCALCKIFKVVRCTQSIDSQPKLIKVICTSVTGEKCPVYEAGFKCCSNIAWEFIYDFWMYEADKTIDIPVHVVMEAAIQAEIDFLESLLPIE